MRREWKNTKENLIEARDYTWDKQIVLLIYSENMDLIVSDIWSEELCYLKYTLVIDSTGFATKEDFDRAVEEYL